ncbi:MAG: hypothetical protein IPH09_13365 [bacterium]|nr:hypothetical protein [bacterium]
MKSRAPMAAALLFIATAAHATALRWEPRWQSVAPGAEASVAVMLDDAVDIRTIEVRITYDPNVITGVTSTPGSIYDGVGCFLWEDYEETTPGLFHAYVVIIGGACYASGPGELLVWHFQAAPQTGVTELATVDVYLSDPQADPLPDLSLGAATIVVSDPATGAPPLRPGPALQLAPNPFNPRTQLIVSSPVACAARLEVRDLAGRSLGTLWSGALGSAPLAVAWDGVDAAGRALPSGAYLFALEAAGGPPVVVRGTLLR